jgi:hypothetical protein
MLIKTILKASLLPSLLIASVAGQAADNWSYKLEPYITAVSIEGDASVGPVNGAAVSVDFDNILENLDIGGMIHFEAHHNNGWGVILDYGFMDLSADISGPRDGIADARLRQGVLEAFLTRQWQQGNATVDVFTGVRWWDNDIELELDFPLLPVSPSVDVEADWVDFVVGARWVQPINDRWQLSAKGDVGGFGLESDFTASVLLGAQFSMTENWDLDLQYKATWVDVEIGSSGDVDYFAYDTVTHGPLVGVIYHF